MNRPIAVELRSVSKSFGKTEALRDVNLSVEKGVCLVLAGPSGAGKTTLLRTIAGLENVDAGDVVIGGKIVNKDGPWRREVGMTFENYALYPHLSVRDNIASPLRSKSSGRGSDNRGKVEGQVRKISEMLRIEPLLDRRTDQLSGGQRQRVSLARCLVRDASVFLLDEPLAHLDAKLRVAMRAEFKRMNAMLNATMIYVTHDYREAMALGDLIAIIQEGKIIQIGTPQEIFETPTTLFVAQFAGHPPMNIVSGVIKEGVVQHNCNSGSPGIDMGSFIPVEDMNSDDGPVQIGFRPMDCICDGGSVGNLKGVVRAVKVQQNNSGSALVETESGLIEAVIEGRARIEYGDDVYINIDVDKVLIFRTDSEQLVGRVSGASVQLGDS